MCMCVCACVFSCRCTSGGVYVCVGVPDCVARGRRLKASAAGWLEPLLDRIARDPTTVVCPVIEVINDDTFQVRVSKPRDAQVGGFNWGLIVRDMVLRVLPLTVSVWLSLSLSSSLSVVGCPGALPHAVVHCLTSLLLFSVPT